MLCGLVCGFVGTSSTCYPCGLVVCPAPLASLCAPELSGTVSMAGALDINGRAAGNDTSLSSRDALRDGGRT
jgi:hypothetical protein